MCFVQFLAQLSGHFLCNYFEIGFGDYVGILTFDCYKIIWQIMRPSFTVIIAKYFL